MCVGWSCAAGTTLPPSCHRSSLLVAAIAGSPPSSKVSKGALPPHSACSPQEETDSCKRKRVEGGARKAGVRGGTALTSQAKGSGGQGDGEAATLLAADGEKRVPSLSPDPGREPTRAEAGGQAWTLHTSERNQEAGTQRA